MRSSWFIALPVPADSWFHRVGEPPHGVRLFDPRDVHLTVAFLGPVDESSAEAAFALAPRWPTGPLDVTLSHVAPMGNPRRPSVLSAHVAEGSEVLIAAIASVRDEMYALARAKPDTRPPLPHVTIARLGRSAGNAERREAVAWAHTIDLDSPRVRLTRLALYTRAQDAGPRQYREHGVFELGTGIRSGS